MSNGVSTELGNGQNGAAYGHAAKRNGDVHRSSAGEGLNGKANAQAVAQAAEAKVEGFEFGGTTGAALIMIWSHLQLYYFWYCIKHNGSSVLVTDVGDFVSKVVAECRPKWHAVTAYTVFIVAQALIAWALPGHEVLGYPLPHEGGRRLSYCCNGLSCWAVSLVALWWLHSSGTFDLAQVMDDLGSYMTSAIVVADLTAVGAYFGAKLLGSDHRMTGKPLYDFFMGAPLNPRVGSLDLKMFTEARVSWIVLFILTLSAACLQWQRYGTVSSPMACMLLAHGLYTHTIMRGEEGIPVTWDIFYEKWGWMLIFWNLAGVPFTYCYQSVFLASLEPFEHPPWYTAACVALLLGSYYVWDTSNSQRCYFRMQDQGTFRSRIGLYMPWLPWRVIKNPEYIQTERGSKLLVSGWWGVARKVNYTADIGMALSWGLICGFGSFVPYFYFVFFMAMIVHRAHRDTQRCAAKYKQDWERYCQRVPYIFVPGIY